MPARNRAMVRRDINRLNSTIERFKAEQPALGAISPMVSKAAKEVNTAWQEFQARAVAGDKEREERETATGRLITWVQSWRPVILLTIPGADMNIRNLPSTGATPDDVIRVAGDMAKFINDNPGAQAFRNSAIKDLGNGLAAAEKETGEAAASLLTEAAARHEYTQACHNANSPLIRSLEIVKSLFGRTSPEYKQFIACSSAEEEEEITTELTAEE